jgi:Uma2 family endonuclease
MLLEQQKLITLKELMKIQDTIEIIDGEMIAMAANVMIHHIVVSNISFILQSYVKENPIGSVFPDGLIYLMYSATSGLKDAFIPDVSFIQNENIPKNIDLAKPYPGVPDLAVEVISENESAEQIQRKARIYLEKGTQQVWIVYPLTKEVHQYQQDSSTIRIYRDTQLIDTSPLFPDLKIKIPDVFQLPIWAQDIESESKKSDDSSDF